MAAENNIEVKFGASTEGLEAGAKSSADAVKLATAEMKAAFASLTEATLATKEAVSGAMEGISHGFEKLNGILIGVTAALAGTGAIKEFVSDSMKLTSESLAMGKALGISATEASYFKSALNEVGVSQETASMAGNRIMMTLNKNEKAFENLGVATRDANGHFLNAEKIMEATNAKLREFAEGTDRNVEGMKIYGRQWSEISGMVSKFEGITDEARERADELNVVVSQESVDAMKKYKAAQRDVGEVMEGIKNTIGDALMPRLTGMAEWFSSIGPQAVAVTRTAMNGYLALQDAVKDSVLALWGAVRDAFSAIGKIVSDCFGQGGTAMEPLTLFQNMIKVVQVAFIAFGIGIKEVINVIQYELIGLANTARMIGGVVGAALHGDWEGVKASWTEFKKAQNDNLTDMMDNAVKIATEGREKIDAAIMKDLSDKGKKTESKGPKAGLHSEGGGGDGTEKAKSQMAEFKEQLREKLEVEGNYFKDSTEAELKFWQDKQAAGKLSVEDARQVHSLIFNLTKKRLQDEHNEQVAAVDAERSLAREKLAVKREGVAALKQAGEITDLEALQRLKALTQEEYEAERTLIQQKIALYGTDAKEKAKLQGELAALEQKNGAAMIKDQTAIAAAVQKTWQDAFAPISTAFDTAVKGIIQGTTTLDKALKNMALSIVTEYANMGIKLAVNWAATEAAKTLSTATGVSTRTGMEATGAATSTAISAGAAIKNIMNNAWEAMSGAFKAMVGIPVVGPALAVGAGAAAFGAVSAIAGSIHSARGGFDIPAGLNPMTQLHEQEMVLPKEQANAVRQMADGGGSGGVQLHVHATDAQSVARLFRDNGHHIVAALQKQRGNLAF